MNYVQTFVVRVEKIDGAKSMAIRAIGDDGEPLELAFASKLPNGLEIGVGELRTRAIHLFESVAKSEVRRTAVFPKEEVVLLEVVLNWQHVTEQAQAHLKAKAQQELANKPISAN